MKRSKDYFKECKECGTLYITQTNKIIRGKKRVVKVRKCRCGEICETEVMGKADEFFD